MFRLIAASVRNKLLLITGSGTALVLLAGGIGVLLLLGNIRDYRALIDNEVFGAATINELNQRFNAQQHAWSAVLIQSRSIAELDRNTRELERAVDEVREALRRAKDRDGRSSAVVYDYLERFETGLETLVADYPRAIAAYRDSDFDSYQGNRLLAGRHAALLELTRDVEQHLLTRTHEAAADYAVRADRAVAATVALILVGVAVAFVVFLWTVQRGIVGPTRSLVDDLERLARGDFSKPVKRITQDELGRVAGSAQEIQQRLGRMIGQLRDVIAQVASAAEQMSVVSRQSSEGARQQQEETTQVATAMNEMAATVQEVARAAADAAQAAEQADGESSSGRQVVTSTVDRIQKLAAEVERAAEVLERLESDSAEINKVLDVIGGIAEQTNLLALNAAIEAARAGEQGRGFAVVADEVRSLAQRTQASTQEINGMIERLQAASRETVQVMEGSREQARSTADEAQHAGQALEAITQAVSAIKDMNHQIAIASEEQTAVAEEMNRNIVNITQVADQTATGSEQTTRAGGELAELAERLTQMVGQFRT